jgi:hypothetical protein
VGAPPLSSLIIPPFCIILDEEVWCAPCNFPGSVTPRASFVTPVFQALSICISLGTPKLRSYSKELSPSSMSLGYGSVRFPATWWRSLL